MRNLKPLQNRAAISVRQFEIKEDCIVNILFYGGESLAAGRYTVHLESFEFEEVLQRHRDIRLIFNNQQGTQRVQFEPGARMWILFLSGLEHPLRRIRLPFQREEGCLNRLARFCTNGVSIIRPGCASSKVRHSPGGNDGL
ncbi:MAG: hypothetical protein LV473_01600 [Nitrospira sp.]|nr:hypothetical protein [Nitrospira sp.]